MCQGAWSRHDDVTTPPRNQEVKVQPRGHGSAVDMDGFSELLVRLSTTSDSSSTHTIYCKRHSVKSTSELTPNEQTLFTLGWPPYVDPEVLKDLFSRAGHVKEVFLQSKAGPVVNCTEDGGFKVIML